MAKLFRIKIITKDGLSFVLEDELGALYLLSYKANEYIGMKIGDPLILHQAELDRLVPIKVLN